MLLECYGGRFFKIAHANVVPSFSIERSVIVYKRDFNFVNPSSCKSNKKCILFYIIFGNLARLIPLRLSCKIYIISFFTIVTFSSYSSVNLDSLPIILEVPYVESSQPMSSSLISSLVLNSIL